jgi:hypothetical protein
VSFFVEKIVFARRADAIFRRAKVSVKNVDSAAARADVPLHDRFRSFSRSTLTVSPLLASQEMYLSPRLLAAVGAPAPDAERAHAHFTLRARREPKRRLPAASSHKGLAHSSSSPDLSARSVSAKGTGRPALNAAASMFAPPSRKPSQSFLRDSAPSRRPAAGAAAKSHLSRARESSTKTMMIDVSEAAQLGTVKGEDLRVEQARREKEEAARERERVARERDLKREREQEEKRERIRKMMEERELKKKQEAERKRARDDANARRKAEMASKRMRA